MRRCMLPAHNAPVLSYAGRVPRPARMDYSLQWQGGACSLNYSNTIFSPGLEYNRTSYVRAGRAVRLVLQVSPFGRDGSSAIPAEHVVNSDVPLRQNRISPNPSDGAGHACSHMFISRSSDGEQPFPEPCQIWCYLSVPGREFPINKLDVCGYIRKQANI